VKNGFSQNINADFKPPCRYYKNIKRHCTKSYFFNKLPNGEKVERKYLVYSIKKNHYFVHHVDYMVKIVILDGIMDLMIGKMDLIA